MTVTIHSELIQGTDEWRSIRCGLLTASEMKLIVTPTLRPANNDKERSHLYELLAQRITKHVEPSYINDDMLRGQEDEIYARALYVEKYAPVEIVGFITNDKWGFTLGYSPDGLVGDDGLIECKSRRQKYQIQTILANAGDDTVPDDYILQVQTALLVSERKWVDFISYSAGLPMYVARVFPDVAMQTAITAAAFAFEEKLQQRLADYRMALDLPGARLHPTERRVEQEMII